MEMDVHMNQISPQNGSATAKHNLRIHIYNIFSAKIGSSTLKIWYHSEKYIKILTKN